MTVTGLVFGDGAPLADAIVEVRNRHDMERTRTDASGRYRVDVLSGDSPTVWVTAHHDQFGFQPCGAWVDQTDSTPVGRTVDVQLSSAEALSGGVPVSTAAGRRRISGTIYALTPAGRQPVSDAIVAWDLSNDDLKAWTQTDSAGRFTLCGLPVNDQVQIAAFAWPSNLMAWLLVDAGGDTSVEMTVQALGN